MQRETPKKDYHDYNMSFNVKALFTILILVISIYLMRPLILSCLTRTVATMSSEYIAGTHSMAFITAPSEEVAKKLAHGLVKNKLVACVNIVPKVTSVYEWEGKIEEDTELLLMLKTRTVRVPDVVAFVRENHPYDVPEVISSPIEAGNPSYLDWISSIVPISSGAKEKTNHADS